MAKLDWQREWNKKVKTKRKADIPAKTKMLIADLTRYQATEEKIDVKKLLYEEKRKEEKSYETEGLPDFSAINTLRKKEPMLNTFGRVFTSYVVGNGYTIIHEQEQTVEELENILVKLKFNRRINQIVTDVYHYGAGYMYIDEEKTFAQRALPEYVRKTIEGGYFYVAGSEEIDISKEPAKMFEISLEPEGDYLYGQSIWTPAIDLIDTYYRLNEEFRKIIHEYASPLMHVRAGGETPELFPSEEALENITRMVEQSKKPGTAITTDKLIEIAFVQPDRGLDIQKYVDFFRKKIISCAMVPEVALMYRSETGRAEESTKQSTTFTQFVLDFQTNYLEPVINYEIIPFLLGKEEWTVDLPKIKFNPPIEYKLKELNYIIKRVNVLNTVDELRAELGYQSLTEEEKEQMLMFTNRGTKIRENPVSQTEIDSTEEKQVRVSEGEKYE